MVNMIDILPLSRAGYIYRLARGRLIVIRPRKYCPMRESRVPDHRHDFSILFFFIVIKY